jgi:AcrR family transcriptional regulator
MMTSTADALMDAGLRLISEHGFKAVTVGDIESDAGFVPRGGTLYKHFASKADLLDAALRRHIDSVNRFDELLALLPLPDRRSEISLLGRWLLTELTREEMITRVIEKEARQLPHLLDAMRDGVSEPGYKLARAYLDGRDIPAKWDRDALAVLLLGSLINLRRSTWTFGKPPLGLDDERALTTWVEMCLALIG